MTFELLFKEIQEEDFMYSFPPWLNERITEIFNDLVRFVSMLGFGEANNAFVDVALQNRDGLVDLFAALDTENFEVRFLNELS